MAVIYSAEDLLFDDFWASPLDEDYNTKSAVVGFGVYVDGALYQIQQGSNLQLNFYSFDPVLGYRTLLYTKTRAQIDSDISAAGITPRTGITAKMYDLVAVLDPFPYFIVAQQSVSGSINATTVVCYRFDVEAAGPVYIGAVRYLHASNAGKEFLNHGFGAIANDRSLTDPVVFVYNGQGNGSDTYFRAWQWPSITEFATLDGTIYASSVETNINISLAGDWDGMFGAQMTDFNDAYSYRACQGAFWMLPARVNGDIVTKLFFYVGRAECQWHIDNPGDPTKLSDFITDNVDDYPNGFTGYINLGTVVYDTTVPWTPASLDRVIDQTILRDQFSAGMVPITLYDNDGTTEDTKGYSDYFPRPTVHKFPADYGTGAGQYVVTFGAILKGMIATGQDNYAGDDVPITGRMLSYIYSKENGYHRLTAKASFNLADRNELAINVIYNSYENMLPYQLAVEIDIYTGECWWGSYLQFDTEPTTNEQRYYFGMIYNPDTPEPIIFDFVFDGTPCFLEETDTTYYDFVARYPNG